MIEAVVREISRQGFRCNRNKLQVSGPRSQRLVTGYTVDKVSVSRKQRDKLRAAIRELERRAAKGHDIVQDVLSIQGRVAHVAQTNPGAAKRLQKQLADTVPSLDTPSKEGARRG